MKIKYNKKFVKTYQKLPVKIQRMIDEKIRLFSKNLFDPQLNNHALTGQYHGYRSINITGDYRAIYREIGELEVIFVILGSHSQLYG